MTRAHAARTAEHGDAAGAGELINHGFNFTMAQSGDSQFLMLKTRSSVPEADSHYLFVKQNGRVADLYRSGVPFAKATSIAARETAQQLGLAYYEGTHGALRRIYP